MKKRMVKFWKDYGWILEGTAAILLIVIFLFAIVLAPAAVLVYAVNGIAGVTVIEPTILNAFYLVAILLAAKFVFSPNVKIEHSTSKKQGDDE